MNNITQLVEYIQTKKNNDLQTAIEQNPNLANKKTEHGISLLIFAAYCRNSEAVEIIKQNKSSFDIFEMIIMGNLSSTQEYFSNKMTQLNQYSVDGFTPIGLASFFGHLEIVALLIQLGGDVNMPANNDFKVTPLHSACATSNLKMAALLLKNDANVNAKQQGNVTPLHSAAHNGQLDLVKLLVDNNAEINAKMENGQTSLSMAEEKSFDEVSAYLRLKGGK